MCVYEPPRLRDSLRHCVVALFYTEFFGFAFSYIHVFLCDCVPIANADRVVRDGEAGGQACAGHLGEGGDGGQADVRSDHAQVCMCLSLPSCVHVTPTIVA